MKRFLKSCLYFTILLLTPYAICAATEARLPQLPDINGLPSTLKSSPVTNAALGNVTVEFEHTGLADIRRLAGAGAISHSGDAGESQYWLCYTVPLDGATERIWLSSSELGGPEHAITGFYASYGSTGMKAVPSCPELPAQLRPVSLGNSIQLGVQIAAIRKLFGMPSKTIGNWQFYSYSGKGPAENFDQLAILGVKVNDGKVVALYESQVTTY